MSGSYNIQPIAYKPTSNDKYPSELNNDGVRSPEDIDVKVPESNGSPFRGMGKEELLQHSSKPFWRHLRMICISIILLGWLALIITVVALVLIYPKCKSPDSRSWWQNEVIYRVYVRSYKDSNGDGVGDLDGVASKLDYIKDLGVGVISLSPTFEDDGNDGEFHIKDHMKIDGKVGGDDALQRLITQAHGKGLKVILDFVPSHTSDQSPWFQWSEAAIFRNDTYRNFYLWTNTTTNWKSMYGGDAWNMSAIRNEYYLHQFLHNQPDLNLRSPQVKEKLNDILVFWLNKSVDGFYIRNSAYLFEDYDLRDEPKLQNAVGDEYSDYDHIYTKNLPEIYDMFARWRTTADGFMNRVLMADPDPSSSEKEMMKYYGHFQRDGVHLPIRRRNFASDCGGQCIKNYVNGWMDNLPAGRWPTWSFGDEMTNRFATNHNESFIRCFSMLTMLLPGTPVLYYGDEINMVDLSITPPITTSRRQPMRGLMQWDGTANGGFTNFSSPWIGIGADHQTNNVKNQSSKGDSLLSFFKNLTTLRSEDTFRIGDYRPAIVDDSVFSFVREFDGKKGYLVAINFAKTAQTRDYTTAHSTIQSEASFDLTTGGSESFDPDNDVDTTSLKLGPMQGVAVSWDYVAKEL